MTVYIYQITFLLIFVCISIVAIRQSTGIKSSDDFSVADRSLTKTGVSWIIIGTLVGGVSTVGTVQAAYTHGISAGIFTFGSGLSCFLLGCFFSRALREEGVVTVSEYLGRFSDSDIVTTAAQSIQPECLFMSLPSFLPPLQS